ncbi:MAG TPA: ATP-binding protein, partial [Candidatus Aenigmarchaeota archaeon]|nr:ATP-binding protein [Candidatus Aenigmarchaeota archaeon]
MQEIGTVISTKDTPSSTLFHFVIKESGKKIPVHKTQFVQVKTVEGTLIARVADIVKTNRYFMNPEAVKEYESSGGMSFSFPIERWEFLVAEAVPLGVYVDGTDKRVTFPPSPGDRVEIADSKILSKFLGFDEKGLKIGSIPFHGIDVKLNLTRVFQKHCSILASTGFGKSYLMSVIIEEILDRDEDLGKPGIVVIDPHGEYVGFAEDENYVNSTRVFSKGNITIGTPNLSASMICEFIPFITSVQRREMARIISQLKKEKPDFCLKDLIAAVELSDIKPVTKVPLISWLTELDLTGIFGRVDNPSIDELVNMGQLSVLDLSDFINLQTKQIIVTYFARKLFEARRAEKIPPFILVIEEAHNFAPEIAPKEASISKGIIETIAREGRKFNASLVLISQRPIKLSTTALSQCNSNFFLRIINPYDIDHITKSCE